MSWLDRQSFLGEGSETTLTNLRLGIAGLCGGGSHIVQQAAHIGIGRYALADRDTMDETNLNRLVGATLDDVEKETPKVDIARRQILKIQPSADVQYVQDVWQVAGDKFKKCDIIVGCLDSVRAKDELEGFCRRFLIPFIDLGMDVHGAPGNHLIAGQVVLSMPGRPCLRCFGLITDEALEREGRNYGAAGGKPQVVWPNAILASTAIGLMMQLMTPWHSKNADSAFLEYDGNTGLIAQSYRVKHLQSHACPHYPDAQRGDPSFDVRRLIALP